jgi:hypothetical protein
LILIAKQLEVPHAMQSHIRFSKYSKENTNITNRKIRITTSDCRKTTTCRSRKINPVLRARSKIDITIWLMPKQAHDDGEKE